jgi:hypothetical protein
MLNITTNTLNGTDVNQSIENGSFKYDDNNISFSYTVLSIINI